MYETIPFIAYMMLIALAFTLVISGIYFIIVIDGSRRSDFAIEFLGMKINTDHIGVLFLASAAGLFFGISSGFISQPLKPCWLISDTRLICPNNKSRWEEFGPGDARLYSYTQARMPEQGGQIIIEVKTPSQYCVAEVMHNNGNRITTLPMDQIRQGTTAITFPDNNPLEDTHHVKVSCQSGVETSLTFRVLGS